MIIATNGKGKNYEEYKIIRYKNTVFLTPPSSELALNPPPLKEEELKYHKLAIVKLIKKCPTLRGTRDFEKISEGVHPKECRA